MIEWRLWFLKLEPQRRTHHLHIIETRHPQFTAKLAFRDASSSTRRATTVTSPIT